MAVKLRKTEQIAFRVDPVFYKKVEILANKENKKPGVYTRLLLERSMEKTKK